MNRIDRAQYKKMAQTEIKRRMGKLYYLRYPVGIALLILVLLMTGVVSNYFANRGNYKTAVRLVAIPQWMERYIPERMDYYKAGVYFQDGLYEEAYAAFDAVDDYDDAERMAAETALVMAQRAFDAGDPDAAYDKLMLVKVPKLTDESRQQLNALCTALAEHFRAESDARADSMEAMIH